MVHSLPLDLALVLWLVRASGVLELTYGEEGLFHGFFVDLSPNKFSTESLSTLLFLFKEFLHWLPGDHPIGSLSPHS